MVSGARRFRANFKLLSKEEDVCDVLFHSPKARTAARLFVGWLQMNGAECTAAELRQFILDLGAGKLERGFSFSRRRFYGTVLATFVSLGFVGRVTRHGPRGVVKVYAPLLQQVPDRNPSPGTWYGYAWLLAKRWNGEWTSLVIVLKTG